jgi:uncharacterized GH25 family protein
MHMRFYFAESTSPRYHLYKTNFYTMKKIIIFSTIFLMSSLLWAHEFWLESNQFIYNLGDKIILQLYAGENFKGDTWKGDHYKTCTIKHYAEDSLFDISHLFSKVDGKPMYLKADKQGTQMITYNNINKYIELKSDEFSAYLKEDGIQEALDYRKTHNEETKTGREFYQRSVKTLVQVGKTLSDDYSKSTDLPVDIIALKNPYGIKANDSLSFKIYYDKKGLAQHMVKIWHVAKGKLKYEDTYTNAEGIVSIPIAKQGKYMISTVKMIRLENGAKADWQSYWASLTFGYY